MMETGWLLAYKKENNLKMHFIILNCLDTCKNKVEHFLNILKTVKQVIKFLTALHLYLTQIHTNVFILYTIIKAYFSVNSSITKILRILREKDFISATSRI